MIGGTMLLCAVGAMMLIALWSLKQDELPDAVPREGLLALKTAKNVKPRTSQQRRRRPVTQQRARRPQQEEPAASLPFNEDEMAAIAMEAEATLPAFIKASREEY